MKFVLRKNKVLADLKGESVHFKFILGGEGISSSPVVISDWIVDLMANYSFNCNESEKSSGHGRLHNLT